MRAQIINMLESVLGISVYADHIPETTALPAASCAIFNESDESAISGDVDLQRYYVQVDIATDTSRLDVDVYKNKLKACQMKPYGSVFQLVRVINCQDAPREPGIEFYQCVMDIELTPFKVYR